MNKDICKKCIENTKNKTSSLYPLGEQVDPWNKQDEKRWKEGEIWCRRDKHTLISEGIPAHCKYKLEHILKEN
jgi:hypothetical protein